MSLETLKRWRFLFPAALILGFTELLGWIIGEWNTTLPDFSKAQYYPQMVIPALLYYITPLRTFVNAPHHRRITEKLRKGLVEISGYPDRPHIYTWENLRSLFFSLVDKDKSLTKKASLAYANGLIWTSFADATALALLYSGASLALYFFGFTSAILAITVFLPIGTISFIGSVVTTNKQINIGQEQLEIIRFDYSNNVKERVVALGR